MHKSITILKAEALALLQQLIATPSVSRQEQDTATCIEQYLQLQGVAVERYNNNIIARSQFFDAMKPTLLLNSHHDTVPPNPGFTRNPFEPIIESGRLYGLGSNDAGGPLVALIACFLHFSQQPWPYNIVLAATAEEEISGPNGIESVLPHLELIHSAIVGEPTSLQMAIAEKGLLVLDGLATGRAGHAARAEGENALYIALQDIEQLRQYTFKKQSPLLGPVNINITSIETSNKAHNMVPAECRFVVDVRVNECYRHEEVWQQLQALCKSTLTPRSMRLQPSFILEQHPLVQAGRALGLTAYGSPTLSDMALMNFPALKLGPGNSARSHTADEFIELAEIDNGIDTYIALVEKMMQSTQNNTA